MTNETKHTPEAEALADAILKAAGTGLRNYSLPKTREAIFAAAQSGLDAGRAELLEALISMEQDIQWVIKTLRDNGYETNGGVLQSSLDQARAAIAKATSETPTGQAA